MKSEYENLLARSLQGDNDAISSLKNLFEGNVDADDFTCMLERVEEKIELNENDSYALFIRGYIYLSARYELQNYDIAIENFNKSAALGNACAMNSLGYMCRRGLGVPIDYTAAIAWFEQASDLGNRDAINNRGLMHQQGQGGPIDYNAAIAWFEKASDLGDSCAMTNLGRTYRDGLGVPIDYNTAIAWFEKASDLGDSHAMNDRGVMHQLGQGGPIDYDAAIVWFKKASELGNSYAMNNLGCVHRDGLGVPVDYAAAIAWFKKATELGNKYSMRGLAIMYAQYLADPNYNEASDLFFKAHQLEDTQAIRGLTYLSDNFSHLKSQFYLTLIYLEHKNTELLQEILNKNLHGILCLLYISLTDFYDGKRSPIESETIADCLDLFRKNNDNDALLVRYLKLKEYLHMQSPKALEYYVSNLSLKKHLNAKDYYELGNIQMGVMPQENKISYIEEFDRACKYFYNAYSMGDNDAKNIFLHSYQELKLIKNNMPNHYRFINEEEAEKLIFKSRLKYRKEAKNNAREHIVAFESFIRTTLKSSNVYSILNNNYPKNIYAQIDLAKDVIKELKKQKTLDEIFYEMQSDLQKFPELNNFINWRLNKKDIKLIPISSNQLNSYRN